jgi:CRP/FNR family transcriptional regulator, cyclic AMP receptor protein
MCGFEPNKLRRTHKGLTMQTLEPILTEHPFLQGLPLDDLRLIVGCAQNVRFDVGQIIFREGEAANQFYLLREGQVALEVFTPEGGAKPILTLSAGDVLGWSWLIPPYQWRFDARAIEPVRAIALDGQCLRGKCDEDPRLGYELLKRIAASIAERLHATRLQMLDVYGGRA